MQRLYKYIDINTVQQRNSFFSLFLSLSLSLTLTPRIAICQDCRVRSGESFYAPKKHDRLQRNIYILQKMVSTKQRFLACSLHVDYKRRKRPRYLKYPGVFPRIWMGSFVTCDVYPMLNDFALW